MLKEKFREANEAQALRQCQWRTVVFDKNGRSYRRKHLFNSESEAAKSANDLVGKLKGLIANSDPEKYQGWKFESLDGTLEGKNYSWHMQMPEMGS